MDKTALTWISAVTSTDKGKWFSITKYPIDMSVQSGYLPAESLWIDWAAASYSIHFDRTWLHLRAGWRTTLRQITPSLSTRHPKNKT